MPVLFGFGGFVVSLLLYWAWARWHGRTLGQEAKIWVSEQKEATRTLSRIGPLLFLGVVFFFLVATVTLFLNS